jgi:predicted DNA-binding protein
MKPRHHIYLDDELSERLDALAAKPGTSKSAIVSDALRAYLDRQAFRGIDTLLGQRLDRISNHLGRLERDGRVLLETVALFVQYELTADAPRPEPDKAMQAIGRDRFDAFIAQVGRRIASGRPSMGEHQQAAPVERMSA